MSILRTQNPPMAALQPQNLGYSRQKPSEIKEFSFRTRWQGRNTLARAGLRQGSKRRRLLLRLTRYLHRIARHSGGLVKAIRWLLKQAGTKRCWDCACMRAPRTPQGKPAERALIEHAPILRPVPGRLQGGLHRDRAMPPECAGEAPRPKATEKNLLHKPILQFALYDGDQSQFFW